MNALSRHSIKPLGTTRGQILHIGAGHASSTRLALALSAALLSPLAVTAPASSARVPSFVGTGVNSVAPSTPQGPLTVMNCNDSGAGSLREIVANVAQSGDTVDLTELQCGRISLSTGEIVVDQDDLTLQGPSFGDGSVTISGESYYRVFHHTGAGTVAVQSLTIADGYYHAADDAYGGCIRSESGNIHLNHAVVTGCSVVSDTGYAVGGGVDAFGGVTLVLSTVSENRAVAYANAAFGGGIYTHGALTAKYSSIGGNAEYDGPGSSGSGGGAFARSATITASTVYNNLSAYGGGLLVAGTATIVDSTISGNTASSARGGSAVYVPIPADSVNILNSTIAFNHQSDSSAFGVVFYGAQANSVLTLQSSIIAKNTAGPADTPADLYIAAGHGIPSGFDNLIIASNIALPPGGFITVTTDPQLSPLQFNGGWTRTHTLLPGSPALGVGNNNAMQANDQRGDGYPRTTINGDVDIGAVQFDTLFADDFDFD